MNLDDQVAAKSRQESSVLARLLLNSGRPSKYDLMCAGERHKLARVFQVDGDLILAVPKQEMLSSFLYSDADPEAKDRAVIVAQTYRLTGQSPSPDTGIYPRCRCGTHYTTPVRVREQIAAQPEGDRWIIVARAISARRNTPQ